MSTIYDILRRPLVTEKSSYQSGRLNQYSFIVADAATRQQVKPLMVTAESGPNHELIDMTRRFWGGSRLSNPRFNS